MMTLDRTFSLLGDRRRLRHWPTVSIRERLKRWFERVVARSAFMRSDAKPFTVLHLPAGYARDLGLTSARVVIVHRKTYVHLWSADRRRPIIRCKPAA